MLLLVAVGLAWPNQVQAAKNLPTLQAAFLRGEYEAVADQARAMRAVSSVNQDALLYLEGLSAFKLRQLDRSRAVLTQLISRHPKSPWLAQAWMALGDSWRIAGEDERALSIYESLLRDPSSKALRPQIRFSIAKAQRRLGRWESSKQTLSSLVQKTPSLGEAREAQRILQKSEFHFSIQVGAFASRANANRLRAELSRRGYETQIRRTSTQGRILHRVRVGRFASQQEAKVTQRRLLREGFPTQIVP